MNSDVRILFQSFRKYWYLFAFTIGFSLLAALFEGFSIGLLIPFLENLDTAGEPFKTGLEWVDKYVLAVEAPQLEQMYRICGFILLATWLRSFFGYLTVAFGLKGRAMVVEDLRMRIIDQLQAVSLRFFSTTRTGDIINSLTNEIQRVGQAFSVAIRTLSKTALLLIYVTLIIWVSWELAFGVLIAFGVLWLGLSRLIASVRRHSNEITSANSRFTSTVSEFINGIRTVKAFNMQAFERKRLHQSTQSIANAVIETTKRGFMVQPVSQAVVSTVLIAVIIVAIQFYVLPGKLSMALLLTVLLAMLRLMPIVQELNRDRGQWATFRAGLVNVAQLIRREGKPYLTDGTREVTGFHDAIEFQNVSFAYEPGEPVLRDINLRIESGKIMAIVGASGAGKSTLVDLILRFHEPKTGNILWDGEDLSTLQMASIRDKIAMVSQNTFIFNDTVRANIAYGAVNASTERIIEAAERANALDFIEDMPNGFDTVLGDQGIRLSGGQRQRIAIARALLRDPQILILDEATSALDSISEKLVHDALERLMEHRTVIVIAHRLSTLENADWVIVLEDGHIEEQGTYEELLARRGQLWKYHSIQFQLA